MATNVEYVWVHPLSKNEIGQRHASPEEAGAWLQSSEGQAAVRIMLFPPTLRAISEGNWSRMAHPDEFRRARSQPAAS